MPSARAESVRLYILAGQSNAVGSGADAMQLPAPLQAPRADIRFWYEVGPLYAKSAPAYRLTSGGAFAPLAPQEDLPGLTFDTSPGCGPEITLGRALADRGYGPVAIVKFAFNGANIPWDWHPDVPDTLFGQCVAVVNTAVADLVGDGHTVAVSGVFWMQGESDAGVTEFADAYNVNLCYVIERFRLDLGEPDLPFVMGRIHEGIWQSPYNITPANLATVRSAQIARAMAESSTAIVNTDDLPLNADWIHFPADGQRALGERFADAYARILQQRACDFDDDGDISSADFMTLQGCITGPALGPPTPGCDQADLDGDVDQTDFGLFQRQYHTGLTAPADCP